MANRKVQKSAAALIIFIDCDLLGFVPTTVVPCIRCPEHTRRGRSGTRIESWPATQDHLDRVIGRPESSRQQDPVRMLTRRLQPRDRGFKHRQPDVQSCGPVATFRAELASYSAKPCLRMACNVAARRW